jgi:hypothetical protein
MMYYESFAELWGWTPSQVDELTDEQLEWLPIIRAAKHDAAEQLRDK